MGRKLFMGARRWWWVAGGLATIILIVAIVLIVQRGSSQNITDQVLVTINGPERVTLGSDVSYDVQLTNNSGRKLSDGKLFVLYPDGFSFTNADPKADNTQGTEYTVAEIAAGAGTSVRISGRLTGGVKTEQVFIARFQFKLEGTAQTFELETSFTTTIETAAFAFAVDGPSTLLPNNDITFDIDLENNEATPLTNVQVRAVYPGGYDFISSTPEPTNEENAWVFAEVGIGQSKEIQIKGKLGGSVGETKRFLFEAGFMDQDGNFLKQTEIEKIVNLNQPTVTISQSVGGQTELVGQPGQKYEYVIEFENTGPAGLTNLALELSFTPGVWDLSQLSISNGGAIKPNNIIRWDGVGVPELRALEAGRKGQVTVTARPMLEIAIDDAADKHFSTVTTPRVIIGNASVDGNVVTMKYPAGISAGAASRVLSGPNPPKVGQTTQYEISWTLTNLYNDLSGARFVGSVPSGAEFVANSGKVSAGEDLRYDPNTRQLIWTIGRVPANVGKLQPNLTATFTITLTPQPNEASLNKVILTAQEFTAKDTWTGQDRKEPIPDSTTEKVAP
jgi:hypothetical protein